eukprot:gene24677-31047_t
MNVYQPRTEDMQFVLSRVLNAPAQLQALPAFAEVDSDLMQQVLGEAGKFVGEVIAPLNRDGDEIGAQWKDGAVTMPPGFKAAYQAFWQAGWPALAASAEDGGQGLPSVLEAMLYEMLSAANHGWTMAPGLLHGAYECIKHHASDELKAQYLEKVATGEWLATMCLTEPHAGSDLGLAATRAVPLPDGKYAVSGTKIFISGGEHDLTDNIVHLVLARLPDAPPGPKGLSLFLVPKFYPDGSRSRVHCDRIEEKMGLHGSPTCVMRFDEAVCAIVGEPGKGLNAMFVMMNAARLHVALQGIGLLDAAWQKADAYAQERRQMRAPGKGKSAGEADLIGEHPAMRRILDTQRAWVDSGRVLAYRTALELDLIKHSQDAATQAAAQRWCALVTPVMKSVFTHQAFHVLADGGTSMNTLLDTIAADLPKGAKASTAAQARIQTLRAVTAQIVKAAAQDAALPYRVADDYLRAVALVLMDWAWLRIESGVDADTPNAQARWLAPAKALRSWVLPEFQMRTFIIVQQCMAAA